MTLKGGRPVMMPKQPSFMDRTIKRESQLLMMVNNRLKNLLKNHPELEEEIEGITADIISLIIDWD